MSAIRRVFTHNIGWKLGSLTLATMLWFAVVGEPELVTVQSVSVYYQNLHNNLVLTTDIPDVQLELQGPSAVLNRESLSGVKILLDLSRVTAPGEQSFTVSGDDVVLPGGVSFRSAVPSRLFLEFDRRVTKEVPVRVEMTGLPAEGYRVTSRQAEPGSVRVSGPEMRIRSIESVVTDPIDVSGRTAGLEAKLNAYVSDPQLQLESPSLVTVQVTIEKGSPIPSQ